MSTLTNCIFKTITKRNRQNSYAIHIFPKQIKSEAISVTKRRGLQGCESSRIPHFVDNRLTDGGEVVSLMRRPSFTPKEIPVTHFC
jgi:hypothetical protein